MERAAFLTKFVSSPLVVTLAVTIFSFFWFLGYEVYGGDQMLYFPALFRSLDPSVLARDFVASFAPNAFTLFDEAIIWIMRLLKVDIFSATLILTFVSRFIYYYALYRIAFYFTQDRKFSLLSLLIFIYGFRVYGTGLRTFGDMLLARDVSTALSLLSMVFLLNRKFIISAIALGIGFMFNPPMTIPFFFIFYAGLWFFSEQTTSRKLKNTIFSVVIYGLFFALLWSFVPAHSFSSNPFFMDQAWYEIVLQRNPQVFTSTWYYPNSSPVYVLASIFFFFLVFKELPQVAGSEERKRYLKALFFVPAGLALFSLITVDLLRISFFMELSLTRGLLTWKLILNLLFTFYAYLYVQRNPKNFFYNLSIIGVVTSFIINEKLMLIFLPAQMFLWLRERYNLFRAERYQKLVNPVTTGLRPWLPWPVRASSNWSGNGVNKIAPVLVLAVGFPVLIYFAIKHKTPGFFESLPLVIIFTVAFALFFRYGSARAFKILSVPLVVVLLILSSFYALPRFDFRSGYLSNADFMKACDWIKDNTDKDDVFLTEPFSDRGLSNALRLTCLRSVFVTKKDGGATMFNRSFALEWKKRYELIKDLDKNNNKFLPLLKEYEVNYLLASQKLDIRYPLVYGNSSYFLYQLR